MVCTRRVLVLACVLVALAPAVGRADDAEKAAETFDALFGADLKRVRETPDARDDAELAARLLDAARKAADQPAFLTVLCEKACDLSVGSPSGLATAAQAMELLAANVPDKAAASRERLLEIRQKQFDAARGDDKKAAGEALLDGLMPLIEDQEKAGALVEAAALCRRAQTVARAAGSPRRAEIDARADALALRMKAARRVDDVKALLARDPQNVGIRESLVRMYLVELDDPAGAATCLDGCKDADLLKYVPAAARPVEAAPELACLELGEWYRVLAEKAPAQAKAAMYGRARAYLDRFLETHPTKDLDQTRATVALGKVNESIAKLAAPPPKSTPREKPAKPEPSQPGVIKPGQWVDLVALVDPAKDAVSGTWRRVGPALALVDPAQEARIGFPVVPEGSYELLGEFVRTSGDDTIAIILPVGSRQVGMMLGHVHGKTSGLDMLYGKVPADNETAVKPGKFDNNRVYGVRVRVLVQQEVAHIAVHVDAKPYIEWRGPVSALSLGTTWSLGQHGCLGLGVSNSAVTWRSVRLRMLSGTARLLRAADVKAAPSPAAAAKPGWSVDLLTLVDPASDGVRGDWKRDKGALGVDCGWGQSALITIPVMPQGSYELEAKFVRTKELSWCMTSLILPVGPTSVGVNLGAKWEDKPLGHALEAVNGKGWDNETVVKSGRIETGVEHTVSATVRTGESEAQVTVALDGKPIIDWRGPPSALSVGQGWALPKPGCLGLAVKSSAALWRSVRIKMLSGTARPLRPAGK